MPQNNIFDQIFAFVPVPTQTVLGSHVQGKANFMALGWLTRFNLKPPIIGARKIEQLQDNLGCLWVERSVKHLQRLNASSRPQPIFPDNFGAAEMFRSAVDGESQIEGGFVEIYQGF